MNDLMKCIKPAIGTIEDIQESWGLMAADVHAIYDLFEQKTEEIPPLLLDEDQLDSIRQQWNSLRDHGMFQA